MHPPEAEPSPKPALLCAAPPARSPQPRPRHCHAVRRSPPAPTSWPSLRPHGQPRPDSTCATTPFCPAPSRRLTLSRGPPPAPGPRVVRQSVPALALNEPDLLSLRVAGVSALGTALECNQRRATLPFMAFLRLAACNFPWCCLMTAPSFPALPSLSSTGERHGTILSWARPVPMGKEAMPTTVAPHASPSSSQFAGYGLTKDVKPQFDTPALEPMFGCGQVSTLALDDALRIAPTPQSLEPIWTAQYIRTYIHIRTTLHSSTFFHRHPRLSSSCSPLQHVLAHCQLLSLNTSQSHTHL